MTEGRDLTVLDARIGQGLGSIFFAEIGSDSTEWLAVVFRTTFELGLQVPGEEWQGEATFPAV